MRESTYLNSICIKHDLNFNLNRYSMFEDRGIDIKIVAIHFLMIFVILTQMVILI